MFYNRVEVLYDHFDLFELILFWVPECSFCKKNLTKRDRVGIFCLRGGGHPFPLLQTIIHLHSQIDGAASSRSIERCFLKQCAGVL